MDKISFILVIFLYLIIGIIFIKSKIGIRIKYQSCYEINGHLQRSFKYDEAAGFDISSLSDCIIKPGERFLLTTGLCFCLPKGVELQIRPRSGFTNETGGLTVLGTIDPDYRGYIRINVINTSNTDIEIKKGQRVAQGVFSKLYFIPGRDKLIRVNTIDKFGKRRKTNRDTNGFGSSGLL